METRSGTDYKIAECDTNLLISNGASSSTFGGKMKSIFNVLDYEERHRNYEKNSLGYLNFKLVISSDITAGSIIELNSETMGFDTFDLSKRLHCIFRYGKFPYLGFYSPL